MNRKPFGEAQSSEKCNKSNVFPAKSCQAEVNFLKRGDFLPQILTRPVVETRRATSKMLTAKSGIFFNRQERRGRKDPQPPKGGFVSACLKINRKGCGGRRELVRVRHDKVNCKSYKDFRIDIVFPPSPANTSHRSG